jgi:hypothetical protein
VRGISLALGIAVIVLLVGCTAPEAGDEMGDYNQAAVLKVSVLQSGSVMADGKPATIATLVDALSKLDKANGVVWYYRENLAGEPSPVAMKVFNTIMAHKRPISISSKPDFSDVVNLKTGESVPRR